jgi:hypothetical protein
MFDDDWNIDLAEFSYAGFLAFFFQRPVVEDIVEGYALFHRSGCDFVVVNPTRVVNHLTEMCTRFAELPGTYSAEQIEQGLWAMFGCDIDCAQYLFDTRVAFEHRAACIESMFYVFRDYVAPHPADERDSFYWMWWDMILHTNGLCKGPSEYRLGYAKLTDDEERVIDVMFATLCRILDLDSKRCQWMAIHGMGHMYHPSVQVRLKQYIDQHTSQLSEDDLLWIWGAGQNRIV